MQTIESLKNTLPQIGRVEWLGIRPGREQPMSVRQSIQCSPEQGIADDRYVGRSRRRQVTLIQFEHLPFIANVLGLPSLSPERLRRNIAVSGINLLALKDQCVAIDEVCLRITGACHPCSKMERDLGPGGYNALRGHGGLTAEVVSSGTIQVGSAVRLVSEPL